MNGARHRAPLWQLITDDLRNDTSADCTTTFHELRSADPAHRDRADQADGHSDVVALA